MSAALMLLSASSGSKSVEEWWAGQAKSDKEGLVCIGVFLGIVALVLLVALIGSAIESAQKAAAERERQRQIAASQRAWEEQRRQMQEEQARQRAADVARKARDLADWMAAPKVRVCARGCHKTYPVMLPKCPYCGSHKDQKLERADGRPAPWPELS